jgi:hypothetical protein
MDGIRDWLVACGATFGCREVHHYRWPDASSRPEVPYLTYRAIRLVGDGPAVRGAKTSGLVGEEEHTVNSASNRQFLVQVRIDLYNSEFGMGWLAKAITAAEKEQAIDDIFRNSNTGFKELVDIEDMTDEDDERIYYHQRMIAIFWTVITHVHKNYNFKVDTVDISDAI